MVTIGQYGGDKIDVTALVKYAQGLETENERLKAERLKLDRRIHNQRVALRETWETVEMRNGWRIHTQEVRSKMLKYWCAAARELKELKQHLGNGQSAGDRT